MNARHKTYLILLALLVLLSSLSGFYISASSPIWGWDSLDSWMPRAYKYLGIAMLPEEYRHGATLSAFYAWLTSLFYPLLSASQSISAIILILKAILLIIIARLFVMLQFGVLAGLTLGFILSIMPLAENLALSVGYSEVFCSFFLLSALAFTVESVEKPSLVSIVCLLASLLILIFLRNTGVVYAALVIFSSATYIFFTRAKRKVIWGLSSCTFAAIFIAVFVDISAGAKTVSVDRYTVILDSNEISVVPENGCYRAENEGLTARLYPSDPSHFRNEYNRDYMPLLVKFDGDGIARIKRPAYVIEKVWVKAPSNSCGNSLEGFAYFPDVTGRLFNNSVMIFSDGSVVLQALGYNLNIRSTGGPSALVKIIAVAFLANNSFSISLLCIMFVLVLNLFCLRNSRTFIQSLQLVFCTTSSATVLLALHMVPYFYTHSVPGADTLFSRLVMPFVQANLFLSIALLCELPRTKLTLKTFTSQDHAMSAVALPRQKSITT